MGFRCRCGHELEIPEGLSDARGECPACGRAFRLVSQSGKSREAAFPAKAGWIVAGLIAAFLVAIGARAMDRPQPAEPAGESHASRPSDRANSRARNPAEGPIQTPAAPAREWTGSVVSVVDGDSIGVMHDGREEKIRLAGIDCPEPHQDFGSRAKQATSDLVFGKDVRVVPRDTDKYGRTVAQIILPDGRNLEHELLALGLAWWYRQYSSDQTLGDLESRARAAQIGLWSMPNPVAPWDFRHGTAPVKAAESASSLVGGSPPARAPPKVEEPTKSESVTVCVTRTGAKYHSSGCRHLSKSKIPMDLADAKARYGPCSVCGPPR